ncbi:hypothetical protein WR25_02372 [Diploscapter pachys]|uniref:Uncharacterized protein n=1 Tax=Diploscapter pachys TaxID=2018661 RepID=A0A2A2JZV9_9BILA|nr:hypothetical protein WR25_02372 [Diploscapter pachys]
MAQAHAAHLGAGMRGQQPGDAGLFQQVLTQVVAGAVAVLARVFLKRNHVIGNEVARFRLQGQQVVRQGEVHGCPSMRFQSWKSGSGHRRSGHGLGVADRQTVKRRLAQRLDQGATCLRRVVATFADGLGQMLSRAGQGRWRRLEHGAQTCVLLDLQLALQAAFTRSDGHGVGDHQRRVAQLAGQLGQHLLQQGLASDIEQLRGIRLGHGASAPVMFKMSSSSSGSRRAGDNRPAQGGHDLPVVQLARFDGQAGHFVIAAQEVLEQADAARLQVGAGETPATGAEPTQVLAGVAPATEFPVEHRLQPLFAGQVVAGAVVAVQQAQGLTARHMQLAPAQAPLQGRVGLVEGVEVAPVGREGGQGG